MRRTLMVLAVGALSAMAVSPGAHASKPAKVWEDPSGDTEVSGNQVGPLAQGGFDLTGGEIARNGENLEFTVTHSAMPPTGTPPEAFRFLWAFSVDGEGYRLTVKRADVGKPDVGQGQTTERVGRVDANGHFRLEGECGQTPAPAVVTFVNCKPLEYLEGSWDTATSSFKVIVPMKSIKAKTKSVIAAGAGDAIGICPICWVSHTAERSFNSTIIDTANMTSTWKVPKK